MQKIVVDAFGGDNAPAEILKGCADALRQDCDISLVITGDQNVIERYLAEYGMDRMRVEIVHAPDVITNDDVPTVAVRKKPESSLVKALRIAKEDANVCGLVSAGSTGAVLSGALLIIGRIPGVYRPALAPLLPTMTKGKVLLIDCGANTDCKPEFLAQFAVMGGEYMKKVCSVANPRIALLSNGTEEKKGNELTHAAFGLLRQLPVNFVGNMEARDLTSGEYDVVVSDGFAGNVCLKASEGITNLVFGALKEEIGSGFRTKVGALLMKPALRRMKHRLDYTRTGGAAFVGCSKVVIKAHGSSKALTIAAAILQAKHMSGADLNAGLETAIGAIDWENLHV